MEATAAGLASACCVDPFDVVALSGATVADEVGNVGALGVLEPLGAVEVFIDAVGAITAAGTGVAGGASTCIAVEFAAIGGVCVVTFFGASALLVVGLVGWVVGTKGATGAAGMGVAGVALWLGLGEADTDVALVIFGATSEATFFTAAGVGEEVVGVASGEAEVFFGADCAVLAGTTTLGADAAGAGVALDGAEVAVTTAEVVLGVAAGVFAWPFATGVLAFDNVAAPLDAGEGFSAVPGRGKAVLGGVVAGGTFWAARGEAVGFLLTCSALGAFVGVF